MWSLIFQKFSGEGLTLAITRFFSFALGSGFALIRALRALDSGFPSILGQLRALIRAKPSTLCGDLGLAPPKINGPWDLFVTGMCFFPFIAIHGQYHIVFEGKFGSLLSLLPASAACSGSDAHAWHMSLVCWTLTAGISVIGNTWWRLSFN